MKKLSPVFVIALFSLFFVSCGSGSQDNAMSADSTSMGMDSDAIVEVDEAVIVPVVQEDAIGNASLKHDPTKAKMAKKVSPKTNADTLSTVTVTDSMPAYPQVQVVLQAFVDSGYTVSPPAPRPDTMVMTASATPLSNTLSVYSVSKHNVKAFEIVSDPSNPDDVEQIIIDSKKKADVYNITPGMKVREMKKIRRKMKHIIKHGKVLYYSDDSNVMYTADLKDGQGDNISEAELDDLDISGVIWESKGKRKK